MASIKSTNCRVTAALLFLLGLTICSGSRTLLGSQETGVCCPGGGVGAGGSGSGGSVITGPGNPIPVGVPPVSTGGVAPIVAPVVGVVAPIVAPIATPVRGVVSPGIGPVRRGVAAVRGGVSEVVLSDLSSVSEVVPPVAYPVSGGILSPTINPADEGLAPTGMEF